MNKQDVLERIRVVINEEYGGNQSAFASDKEISKAYINDVLRERRDPGQKILGAVGIEKATCYRLKEA